VDLAKTGKHGRGWKIIKEKMTMATFVRKWRGRLDRIQEKFFWGLSPANGTADGLIGPHTTLTAHSFMEVGSMGLEKASSLNRKNRFPSRTPAEREAILMLHQARLQVQARAARHFGPDFTRKKLIAPVKKGCRTISKAHASDPDSESGVAGNHAATRARVGATGLRLSFFYSI